MNQDSLPVMEKSYKALGVDLGQHSVVSGVGIGCVGGFCLENDRDR